METSPAPQRRATTSIARRTIPQCRIIDACNYCAVDDSGAASYARSLPPSSLRRSHHDDLLHLDKEINYEWYAEALVKSLNCIEKFNPEDTTGANGSHLLEYHIILSRLFTSVVHSPRTKKYPKVLRYILHHLSNIWTQSEWKTNLIDTFCNILFRTTFLDVVVFFEKELEDLTKKSNDIDQGRSRTYQSLTLLLQLILPPLLMLLQYIQSLWTEAVSSNIPDVLEDAKFMVFYEDGRPREVVDIDVEEQEENAIREWLETTRQSGYKVIGMCAKLEGMFGRVLDSSAVCGALMKDLESMGFHHLDLFIKHTIIPLMENCPEGLRPEWVVDLLYPVFHYFQLTLDNSWCGYLRKGLVRVPDTIDYVPVSKDKLQMNSQSNNKQERELLIQLTHAASDLLAVIASPKLNGGLDFICSKSLVRCVLFGDGIRHPVLSLIYHIFGSWKDDTAKAKSVSFCHMIVRVANATHHEELISFVQDDLIPLIIRYLTLESISDSTNLTDLCRDAYYCVQNQDLVCKGEHNESTEVFDSWLEKQKIVVRCRNTPFHELDEFVWPWEEEEEFKDYFPAYIDMLHEVDEMNDCLECSYSSLDDLFEKLKPEFVSRHAIDSASHDYVWTMSDMLSRKMSAKHWQRYNDQMHKFICELINLKPHIQHSTYDESLVDFVQNLDVCPDLDKFSKAEALEGFCTILSLWEPQFHPLIREGHKDVLTEMIHHSFYVENITHLQPLRPDLSDFPVHLRPRALNHIDDNNKLYHMAKDQARLHEDFDTHLSSGEFDDYICKGDALNAVCDAGIIDSQFPDLDHSLIELSFERRGKLLAMRERLNSYHKHLRDVVGNEQLRIELQSLMCELEAEGFFNVDDDSIDWDKKCFSQLMDKFDKQVFTGLGLPKYYVARGIMDYRAMSLIKDDSRSWDEVFEKVADEPYHRWIQNIPLYWMDTRYYKHQYYDIIQQPLQKLWKLLSRVDAPLDLEATIDKIKATTASLSSLRQGHNP